MVYNRRVGKFGGIGGKGSDKGLNPLLQFGGWRSLVRRFLIGREAVGTYPASAVM